ncbi:NAD(P)/FAD-dependent oxidoreductase [Aurantiacibacter gangjinensis]|uniref:Uncharacterized protein n=1 Tax=Aurantiacibacter gangjinensis TaxID=502682 RepID=A0A0G9MTN9_9SPHN|nr:FAD-dependent monooxygenase [Aurantiacibacter gangjinensis]APE28416.1 NAD binding site [Aurantiacibacter gangjinensis]KLE32638.1 hypothetical protein AAW01_00805 [Aurantiacibacter gangjinensis]
MADSPLILGAGPAGCAAAIVLGQAGIRSQIIDRDAEVGDPLCGGFLSWRTAEQLSGLRIDIQALGAHRVTELRLFRKSRESRCPLPQTAYGLSRHALDTAMRLKALSLGAQLAIDTVRGIEPGNVHGTDGNYAFGSLFLATGKHDVRGHSRPRPSNDPALGLRLRLPASDQRTKLLDGAIELHLFDGGYIGIVLQEGGSANFCLALKKSALSAHGGDPAELFARVADDNPALAARLGHDWREGRIESIGAVPYGFIARETQPGIFRLGDQGAVIPSLAGEGISIALASGHMAAQHWLAEGPQAAPAFQRNFAAAAQRPVVMARLARTLAESALGAQIGLGIARMVPSLIGHLADATRIVPKSRLARLPRPA